MYQAYNRNNSLKTRIGCGMLVLICIPLAINNALTPELAEMCKYKDADSYFTGVEFIIHGLYFGSMTRVFMRYTLGKEDIFYSSHKHYI